MTAAAIDLREVLASVPRDGSAFFLYALLIFCFVLVWRANRGGSASPAADAPPPSNPPQKGSR